MTSMYLLLEINISKNFPGGQVIKNPPPKQGTQVPSQVQEDFTCLGATKAMYQMTEAYPLEPVFYKRSHYTEKPNHCNQTISPLSTTRESSFKETKI